MRHQWNRFFAFLLRDGLIIAAVGALWAWTLRLGPAHDLKTGAVHVLTGLATVFVGYLFHEWGHLLGAWSARGHFELPRTVVETMFLFRFDNVRNTRKQFVSMTLGGFASSIVVVAAMLVLLPWGLLATYVALGLTAAGVAATFIIEVPEFLGVVRGGPMPSGAAFISDGGPPRAQ
jgi:hypothetical protein